jgi:CBS-domain-containing membrane protein
MTPGIHCCRDDDDLAKAVRHMEALKVRRLPVINKSKRMVGILSLGDISHCAPGVVLAELGQERFGPSLKCFGALALARVDITGAQQTRSAPLLVLVPGADVRHRPGGVGREFATTNDSSP